MNHFSRVCKALTLTLLSASLTLGASAASFGVGTVNASALHLRAQPTTASASLMLARRNSTVDVLDDAINGWYRVSCNGMEGYMSAEYLTVIQSEEDESGLGNGKVTLESGVLNIRSTASLSGSEMGTIPNGTVVALSEYVDGWYLITYQDITGYVAEQYITLTDEAVTVENAVSGADVVAEAQKYLGCPYSYGKAGPNSFDCSGFTSYIYKKMGYTINRTASSQLNQNGTSVAYSDLQPGDLVFFRDYGCTKSASHVGIYIGDGQFIHASSSSSSKGVKISSLSETWYANRYVGAKRILA